MSTPITRDEALTLIRRKGSWSQPFLFGVLVANGVVQTAVQLPRALREDDTVWLWLFGILAVLLAVAVVVAGPPVWRQWRASRHPAGVQPLTVLDGPLTDRPVQDADGQRWEIAWGGNVVRPGTTVWATPLEEGTPYFVVVPGPSGEAQAAQVVYWARGPVRLL